MPHPLLDHPTISLANHIEGSAPDANERSPLTDADSAATPSENMTPEAFAELAKVMFAESSVHSLFRDLITDNHVREDMFNLLERGGLVPKATWNQDGVDFHVFENVEGRVQVLAHDAVSIGESTAGSVSLCLRDGKVFFTFSVPAPSQLTITKALLEGLISDSLSVELMITNVEHGKKDVFNHENSHLICMQAGTTWGKVMFTHMLDSAIQARIENQGEPPAIALTRTQANNFLKEAVTEEMFHGAVLISELRAHRYNFGTSPELAHLASKLTNSIEGALEALDASGGIIPLAEDPKKYIAALLTEWQKSIGGEDGSYEVGGASAVKIATDLLCEQGSILTKFDPVHYEQIAADYERIRANVRRDFLNP